MIQGENRNKVTRTIQTVHITARVYDKGKSELTEVERDLPTSVTEAEKIEKVARKSFEKEGYTFLELLTFEVNTTVYAMSLTEFIKNATKIEKEAK